MTIQELINKLNECEKTNDRQVYVETSLYKTLNYEIVYYENGDVGLYCEQI